MPTLNIYQKLAQARVDFLAEGAKKSGINAHAEFTYFELEDIVPLATKIFNKHNCLFVTTFPQNTAIGKLINLENPQEVVQVEFEARPISEPAKFRMNETQARGAELTYMRRYLYFLILDIIESDGFDGLDNKPEQPKAPKKPVTKEERQEIKTQLTGADDKATDLQINALKEALSTLRKLDESQEEFIQQVAFKTDGFTTLTKNQWEQLMVGVGQIISELKGE